MLNYLKPEAVQAFIRAALAEDLGEGDFSSQASVPAGRQSRAQLLIKDEGILAGVELAQEIFREVDPELRVVPLKQDGESVRNTDIALTVAGKARSILKAERLVLNCMQRMSAIATYTHRLTSHLAGTSAKLLDTRKTTPNFRLPEKWAVHIGGGHNHRFDLSKLIMLKDNHIDYAGGIEEALNATELFLNSTGRDILVEIEVRNLKELEQVLEHGGVHRIMLDNFEAEDLATAIEKIAGRYETEASGGITESRLREVAQSGVDYISVGALTHSVSNFDLSLKAY